MSVWTHRSTVEALGFTLAWHYLLIEVLRFLVLATEGSVSKLTADDTLTTPDCVFGHTHFVALKMFLDHF